MVRGFGLVVGQDLWSVRNYSAAFPRSHLAGVMSYVALADVAAGLDDATDYGTGIEWARGLVAAYDPSTALQLGLYLKGALDDVNNGALDAQIRRLAAFADELAPRLILLRIGYEFDSPLNGYEPAAYIAAFRRVAAGMPVNVRNVWHSWAFAPWEADGGAGVAAWWPGEEHVDVCAVSIFQQAFGDYAETPWGGGGNLSYAHLLADFCEGRGKPLIIAESTPFGLGVVEPFETIWARWFEPVLDFIEKRGVTHWSYINCDWDAQPMWHGQGWGDTRIEADPNLKAHWEAQVLDAPVLYTSRASHAYYGVAAAAAAVCAALCAARFCAAGKRPARGPDGPNWRRVDDQNQ